MNPRRYASNAERQRAYRLRHSNRNALTLDKPRPKLSARSLLILANWLEKARIRALS